MDIPISARDIAGPAQQAASAPIQNDPPLRPPAPVAPVPKVQGSKNEVDDGKKSPKKTSGPWGTEKNKAGGSRKTGGRTPAFVVSLQHQNSNRPHLARTKDLSEQGDSFDRGLSSERTAENGVRPEESGYPESQQVESHRPEIMDSSSESPGPSIHGPGGPQSVTLDGLTSNVSSVPDSPEETARKMDMVRRAVLMTEERDESDHFAAIAAAMTSAGARWEIVQEQREKVMENLLSGQEAREGVRVREEAREAREAREAEEEKKERESKRELPSLPNPSRYAVPLSDSASVYTPRFSEPRKTQFNTKALDAKSSLGSNSASIAQSKAVGREMTLARQGFSRATASPQETRPMIQIRV